MGEIKDMLLKTYLKKGARPPEAKNPEPTEPELKGQTPPKPIPVDTPKTMGDISLAMAAQRIYNPQMPPAPPMQKPKPPNKAMLDQGTAPAMGMQGPWATPETK